MKEFNIKDIEIPNTTMLIGHNRYSTSGDWKNENNNQPLELNRMFLVFNGVIDMGTKKEMEKKHNIKMKTNNDGEIFLHYLDKMEPLKIVDKLKCSFAGLFIKDNEIYCLRNNHRPLWRVVINKSVFVASTKDIFKRSGYDNAKPIAENKTIKLKDLLDKTRGIQKVSYSNDGKWGYRSSVFLPTLHSKQI